MKKILLIGATGTVGTAVARELERDHQVIRVGKSRGDHQVDVTRDDSVERLFAEVGRVDAIVSTIGQLFFGPVTQTSAAQFAIGLQDKLLGQVRLALVGQHHLNDGGSITLTSGIVSEEIIHQGANATAVNAALEGFARAAATELARGQRINVVSPSVLQESWAGFAPFFPGFEAVPASRVALAYRRSVEGPQTGRTFKVW